jgi:hypothetical protein
MDNDLQYANAGLDFDNDESDGSNDVFFYWIIICLFNSRGRNDI